MTTSLDYGSAAVITRTTEVLLRKGQGLKIKTRDIGAASWRLQFRIDSACCGFSCNGDSNPKCEKDSFERSKTSFAIYDIDIFINQRSNQNEDSSISRIIRLKGFRWSDEPFF